PAAAPGEAPRGAPGSAPRTRTPISWHISKEGRQIARIGLHCSTITHTPLINPTPGDLSWDEDVEGTGTANRGRRAAAGARSSPRLSPSPSAWRSEEHTSELQSRENHVCR